MDEMLFTTDAMQHGSEAERQAKQEVGMGAWGTGIFEDDDALDWVGSLTEATTIVPLVDALRATETRDYLEASASSAALVAAEVLAALNGKPSTSLPDNAADWVSSHPLQVNAELLRLALAAIRRIETESELQELWAESDEFSEWQAGIRNLETRLVPDGAEHDS